MKIVEKVRAGVAGRRGGASVSAIRNGGTSIRVEAVALAVIRLSLKMVPRADSRGSGIAKVLGEIVFIGGAAVVEVPLFPRVREEHLVARSQSRRHGGAVLALQPLRGRLTKGVIINSGVSVSRKRAARNGRGGGPFEPASLVKDLLSGCKLHGGGDRDGGGADGFTNEADVCVDEALRTANDHLSSGIVEADGNGRPRVDGDVGGESDIRLLFADHVGVGDNTSALNRSSNSGPRDPHRAGPVRVPPLDKSFAATSSRRRRLGTNAKIGSEFAKRSHSRERIPSWLSESAGSKAEEKSGERATQCGNLLRSEKKS